MELDELKTIWQNKTNFTPKGEAELASMLKGNSKSVVSKLKGAVWFELILTFVAGVLLLAYALSLPSGGIKWTTVSILALFVAFSVYYIKKLLLLNRFNPGTDNLRETLEKLIESLTSYLNFYRRSYAILYPVYFMLGLLFGFLESGSDRFFQKMTDPKVLLYLALWGGLFFVISTKFANWYLKKLYGNHLDKLKNVLAELKAERAEAA